MKPGVKNGMIEAHAHGHRAKPELVVTTEGDVPTATILYPSGGSRRLPAYRCHRQQDHQQRARQTALLILDPAPAVIRARWRRRRERQTAEDHHHYRR